MFSDAISSISWRCRPSSPLMAAAISGSASASVAVKKESGAEAVLAEELIGEISPPPQVLKELRAVMGGGRKMSLPIPYRAALAKPLRYRVDIYARCGGDGLGCQSCPRCSRVPALSRDPRLSPDSLPSLG